MKKYGAFLLTFSFIIPLLISCKKQDAVIAPDAFEVATLKQTYKKGDSVFFNFNINADKITFYSGEPGKKYENRNLNAMGGINKLVFQSSMQNGVFPNNDSLRLLISANLKSYDATGIQSASWTDITSRNTKWPTALGTAFTTSDSIDISDFNTADSVNIAFRFLGKKYPSAAQRKWQIQNLALGNRLADGTTTPYFAAPVTNSAVATPSVFQYTGWVQASLKNNTLPGFNAWNVGTAGISASNSVKNSNGIDIRSAYPIQFDPGATLDNDDNDDWLITNKVNLKKVRPDVGVTIKNEVNSAFAGLNYVYNKIPGIYAQYLYFFRTPGTYTITFVASNINQFEHKDVVRAIQLVILP